MRSARRTVPIRWATTSTVLPRDSRATAEERGWLSPRISRWDPADVLLVVEVSDETVVEDLDIKARLYGAAGYAAYWVLTREAVFEHTGPGPDGYRTVVRYRRGEEIPLPYADRGVAVSDLLGEDDA